MVTRRSDASVTAGSLVGRLERCLVTLPVDFSEQADKNPVALPGENLQRHARGPGSPNVCNLMLQHVCVGLLFGPNFDLYKQGYQTMKRIHVICALALAVCTPAAMAAGAGGQTSANFNWSGAYAGVNIGGGFGTFKHSVSLTGGGDYINGSLDFTAGGFLGGAQVGYNFQSGKAVYGIELDLQGSGVEGSGSLGVNTNLAPVSVAGEVGTKVDWFSTLRGRIGYLPTDRFLIYGTGGLAYGRVHSYLNASLSTPGPSGSIHLGKSKSEMGWVVGVGAEYAITDRVTIKSEYMYVDLGKASLLHISGVPAVNVENDVAFQMVRVGLNYKF